MDRGIPQRKNQSIPASMEGEKLPHMSKQPKRESGSMNENMHGQGYMKSMAPFSKNGCDYNAEAYKY